MNSTNEIIQKTISCGEYTFTFTGDPKTHSGNIESNLFKDDIENDSKDVSTTYKNYADAIESLLLAQYCAGINITTHKFKEALESSIESIINSM